MDWLGLKMDWLAWTGVWQSINRVGSSWSLPEVIGVKGWKKRPRNWNLQPRKKEQTFQTVFNPMCIYGRRDWIRRKYERQPTLEVGCLERWQLLAGCTGNNIYLTEFSPHTMWIPEDLYGYSIRPYSWNTPDRGPYRESTPNVHMVWSQNKLRCPSLFEIISNICYWNTEKKGLGKDGSWPGKRCLQQQSMLVTYLPSGLNPITGGGLGLAQAR